MRKSDLVTGTALAGLSLSASTLMVLTGKGTLTEEESSRLHTAVLTSLAEARSMFGNGPVDAALAIIERNIQIAALDLLTPTRKRSN